MSEYFEIAYAGINKRLCFFTGTGFSKAVSVNQAPGWQQLLESVAAKCDHADDLKSKLFPSSGRNPLALDEAAQIISIELMKKGLSIHDEIKKEIARIELGGDLSALRAFCEHQSFRVITTNYDKLMEKICGERRTQSLTPGLPIPRSQAEIKVYHVHGSIDAPENMVVTADDYFNFLNRDTYFSRKMSTILHENTVVILGYSLGDTNLKSIMSDYKVFLDANFVGSSIFLVSRSKIEQHIKDYYAQSYGIRVIDSTEVDSFFKNLLSAIPEASKCKDTAVENIRKVIYDGHVFTDSYLKLSNSFYEIVSSLAAVGASINDPRVVEVIGLIIDKKAELTLEAGAWDQYRHLAEWLIYLGTIFRIRRSSIEGAFLAATLRSMNTMSKDLTYGRSWYAYRSWDSKWGGVTAANRQLIREHITKETGWPDALSIVNR